MLPDRTAAKPEGQENTAMKPLLSILLITLSLPLTGCMTAPVDTHDIDISAEYDPGFDFSSHKSYRWRMSSTVIKDSEGELRPPGFDPDVYLRSLVDSELKSRGYSAVADKADVTIAYAAGVDTAPLETVNNPQYAFSLPGNTPVAAMTLVMTDEKSGYSIWVARATGDITRNADDRLVRKRLEYVVREMFKYLPRETR